MTQRISRWARDQRGAIALWSLLFLPVSFLLLGLTADYGRALALRTELAAACDFAALAGAQELDLDALERGARRLEPEPAEDAARRWFAFNADASLRRYRADYTIEVRVLNAGQGEAQREPWSGKTLSDPTVAVFVQARIPTVFVRSLVPTLTMAVHADASVLAHP